MAMYLCQVDEGRMITSVYKKDGLVVKRKRVFVPERLRSLREKTPYNQSEFAALVGIKQNQYTRYENGASEPMPHLVVAFAHALNTSTDYLLGFTDDPHPPSLRDGSLTTRQKKFLRLLDETLELEDDISIDTDATDTG